MVLVIALIGDGQRLFADALGSALGRYSGLEVLQDRPVTGLDAVRIAARKKPEIAVLDYWMEGISGAAAAAVIRRSAPATKVLILGWFFGPREVSRALSAGAAGFLSKGIPLDALVRAIDQASTGDYPVWDDHTEHLVESGAHKEIAQDVERYEDLWWRFGELTPKEIEVVVQLGSGRGREEDAQALGVTPATMRTHIERILRKMGATSQTEALALARRHGFLTGLTGNSSNFEAPARAPRSRTTERVRVLVADAQPLFADAVAAALGLEPVFDVLHERPASGPAAIGAAVALDPDVVVLDYWIGSQRGPETTSELLRRVPGCKVLLLSWCHGPEDISKALRAGAAGFIPKSATVTTLAAAVRQAHAGETLLFGPQLAALLDTLKKRLDESGEAAKLLKAVTGRELEVLMMMSLGHGTEEIAQRLGIEPGTVKSHIHAILTKTGTVSRAEAIAVAHRSGLLSA